MDTRATRRQYYDQPGCYDKFKNNQKTSLKKVHEKVQRLVEESERLGEDNIRTEIQQLYEMTKQLCKIEDR